MEFFFNLAFFKCYVSIHYNILTFTKKLIFKILFHFLNNILYIKLSFYAAYNNDRENFIEI